MDENMPGPEIGTTQSVILMLLAILLTIIPFWRIFSKAGYSGWFSILMIIPFVNLIALYFLAFANWPVLRAKETLPSMTDSKFPPSTMT